MTHPERLVKTEASGYIETKVQYKDQDVSVDFLIDHDTLKKTVFQVKQALLQLDPFQQVVSEPLENLGLYLILGGTMSDERDRVQEMTDDSLLIDFSTELAHAKIIKLLSK